MFSGAEIKSPVQHFRVSASGLRCYRSISPADNFLSERLSEQRVEAHRDALRQRI